MTQTRLQRVLALLTSFLLAVGIVVVTVPAVQAVPTAPTLSGLTLSTGVFEEAFDPSVTTYHATVPNTVGWFSFTPTTLDENATITTWNGAVSATTPSGVATANSWLRVGNNIMTATVTAQDGVTRTDYTIIIVKEAPPAPLYDLNLGGISVSSGTLSPAFSSAVTSYTVDVPYTTNTVTVTPGSVASGNAVTVTTAGSGAVGSNITLMLGTNMVLVTVVAPDNTSKVYNVQITRGPAPTANVDLADITLSKGSLSPAFDPSVASYSVRVPYAVRSVGISATAAAAGNSLTINNAPMVEGVASTVPVNFNGSSSFAITVTAPNGVQKTYVVTVTREQPSNNANLTGLSIAGSTLSPAFSNAETSYTATVPYLTTSTTVTATVADETAILRIKGRDTASGVASAPIALAVGQNSIVVAATAEDGVTTTTRTIVVTREAPDLDLSALTVTGGSLSPAFDADTTEYTLALPYTVTSVDVAAAAVESDWTLAIQGAPTTAKTVAIPVGSSTITVRVTALHGESRTYTIAVTRQAASTNANLGGITLSDGTLSPAFSAGATAYTATVPYLTEQITVGAAVADSTAVMTINGQSVTSAVVPLAVGPNTVTVVTTAQDGTTTVTTTVVVTRQPAPAPIVAIELGFGAGDVAANAPLDVIGTNLRPGSTATVTMHSTPVVLASGIVGHDGTITLSARIPANATAGAHRLVFEGTAMDGSATTETAWLSVLRNGKIGAVSLTAPVIYSDPAGMAVTGADSGFAVAAGTGLAVVGALLLMLGAVIRRRRRTAE